MERVDRMAEPRYTDVEAAAERLDRWVDEADTLIAHADAELPTVQRFRTAAREARDRPDIYTPELMHGTDTDGLAAIAADGAIRPSAETGTDAGEVGGIPVVSSTSSPGIALAYTRTRPTRDEVLAAASRDLPGEPLDAWDTDALDDRIDTALATDDWRVDGRPVAEVDVSDGYVDDLRHLYAATRDRLDAVPDHTRPAVLGYGTDALVDDRGATTLYRNEVGKDHLAEVQSGAVEIDGATVYLPPGAGPDALPDDATVASLDALTAMHCARNHDTYRDAVMTFDPVWHGPRRRAAYGTAEPERDRYDRVTEDITVAMPST